MDVGDDGDPDSFFGLSSVEGVCHGVGRGRGQAEARNGRRAHPFPPIQMIHRIALSQK